MIVYGSYYGAVASVSIDRMTGEELTDSGPVWQTSRKGSACKAVRSMNVLSIWTHFEEKKYVIKR